MGDAAIHRETNPSRDDKSADRPIIRDWIIPHRKLPPFTQRLFTCSDVPAAMRRDHVESSALRTGVVLALLGFVNPHDGLWASKK
jgi:hypothetical protein